MPADRPPSPRITRSLLVVATSFALLVGSWAGGHLLPASAAPVDELAPIDVDASAHAGRHAARARTARPAPKGRRRRVAAARRDRRFIPTTAPRWARPPRRGPPRQG